MALRGNLRDFSLPDVFQLVQLSGKTGVLRIKSSDAEGSVWFREGDVFFAQSNWHRDLLGQRLVSAGRITPSALTKVLEIRRGEAAEGRRLGQILVEEGYLTENVLESFVQEQIQDTIFDLMRWDEGDFDFEVLPDVVDEDIGLSVSIENIVMEGSRRIEEWNRIKKKVPSTEMVFKMATAPGEGTFEISLKPTEWNLLLLVDGTRTVAQLATDLGKTDFEVARVIYGLFSAGLLEVAADDEVARLRSERAEREDKRAVLEAERAARDRVAAAEAIALEEQLAAEAEARRVVADRPAAVVEPEAAALAEPEPSRAVVEEPVTGVGPQEVPEFLSVSKPTPTADDMAVFEQMMEAVLQPAPAAAPGSIPEPEAAPGSIPEPEAAPEPIPEPEVEPEPIPEPEPLPAPEPVFEPELVAEPGVATEAVPPIAPGSEFEILPAFEVSELLEPQVPTQEPEAEVEQSSLEPDLGFGAISGIDAAEIPAPPVAEKMAIDESAMTEETQGGYVPTGDLETDLLALGLGELPPEVSGLPTPEEPTLVSDLLVEALGVETQEEPTFEPAPVTEEGLEELDVREPMSLADLQEAEVAQAPEAGGDLDDLLRSLSVEDEIAGVGAGQGSAPSQVISTDAYLAEFESDVGLSGGMGDEITALTGGGSGRSRPVTTVNKIPEPGDSRVMHLDQMVDRDLVRQIIDGIQKL